MNVEETERFWREREAHYPQELASALREFSREAHTKGELVLCGTLRTAAERLERGAERLEPVPALDYLRGLETGGER